MKARWIIYIAVIVVSTGHINGYLLDRLGDNRANLNDATLILPDELPSSSHSIVFTKKSLRQFQDGSYCADGNDLRYSVNCYEMPSRKLSNRLLRQFFCSGRACIIYTPSKVPWGGYLNPLRVPHYMEKWHMENPPPNYRQYGMECVRVDMALAMGFDVRSKGDREVNVQRRPICGIADEFSRRTTMKSIFRGDGSAGGCRSRCYADNGFRRSAKEGRRTRCSEARLCGFTDEERGDVTADGTSIENWTAPEGCNMYESSNRPHRKVFFISSLAMSSHKCEWDDEHIEVPERLENILTHLTSGETDVLDECEILQACSAGVDDIRLVHNDSYIKMISKATQMNVDELESFCSGFEDVYANQQTYNACMLSAGCALEAMKAVIAERNGFAGAFAVIRPPGHHASRKSACGFCFFNNVAICAKKARQMGVKRVLIVDWDVHAGQGTQYCIDDDENIRLISMHRYEYGKFWPQLPESAIKHSYANTLNVTLNKTGLGDAEYVAFMKHIVVPVIADFLPSLILVSCGFDAAYGDPEGRMKVTPGAYQWMTHILVMQSIKFNARLCLLLEGGYFIETLPMNVEFCLKGLLGHPLPYIPLNFCNELFLNSVHTAAVHYGAQFPSLQLFADVTGMIRQLKGIKEIKLIEAEYEGIREFNIPYPTRGVYRRVPKNVIDGFYEEVMWIVQSYYYGSEEPRKLMLYFDEKTTQDETSASVIVTVDKTASTELVKQFLQIYVCEASLSVVEDISIKKSEFSTDYSLKKRKMTDETYRATIANICVALLKIFDEGFASDLEHTLFFDR